MAIHDNLFGAALEIASPWFVAGVRFNKASKILTVGIDSTAGEYLAYPPLNGTSF